MIQLNSMTAKQHFTEYEDKKQDGISLKRQKQNIVPLATTVKLSKI